MAAFLIALLRHPVSRKQALTVRTESRRQLIQIAMRVLKELSSNPLLCFLELWEYRIQSEGNETFVDLIKSLFMNRLILQEILSEAGGFQRDLFDSIEKLLFKSAAIGRKSVENTCTRRSWPPEPMKKKANNPVNSEPMLQALDDNESRLAKLYCFASTAKFLGSLAKNCEEGSQNMSKTNGISSLLQYREHEPRKVLCILEGVLTILHNLETSVIIPVMNSEREVNIMVEEDLDKFGIVVDTVRAFICGLIHHPRMPECASAEYFSRNRAPHNSKQLSVATNVRKAPPIDIPFGIDTFSDFGQEVSYFDDESQPMKLSSNLINERGCGAVSQYERDSNITSNWTCLRSNAYVGRARSLLTEDEKSVGELCSCLLPQPGDESKTLSNTRLGCANGMCENRMANMECGPGECGGGKNCKNRRLQKLEYSKTKPVPMKGKGIGLVADENIEKGDLIGEYLGEVVTVKEFEKRKKKYAGEKHFYFMALTNKLTIDASRKSQITRFLNHSCEPNCIAEKWNAGGEPRVAIIANRSIEKGEELTLDYGTGAIGSSLSLCLCGSTKCRGKWTADIGNTAFRTDVDSDV